MALSKGVTLSTYSRIVQGTPGFEVQAYPDRFNIHINDWNIIKGQYVRVGYMDLDASVVIDTETLNDNSVKYTIRGVHFNWYRYRSENNYHYTFKISFSKLNAGGGRTLIYERQFDAFGGTLDHHINSGSDIVASGILPPNMTRNASVGIELFHLYNDAIGSALDDEAYGGITITNTNPPSFKPRMTFDARTKKWESNNRTPEGINLHYKNGQWLEFKSIAPYNDANGNSEALYYENGRWKNQDKVGDGR